MEEIKVSKDSRTPTKISQNVRKKNFQDRTFASEDFKKDSLPEYNGKSNMLGNLEKEYQNAKEEKYIINLEKIQNIEENNLSKILNIKKSNFIIPTKVKKIDTEQIEKHLKNNEFYQYELNISDSRIKYLNKIIKENPNMSAKEIDIINQLKSLYTIEKNILMSKLIIQKVKHLI